jgi:hypothetical protein
MAFALLLPILSKARQKASNHDHDDDHDDDNNDNDNDNDNDREDQSSFRSLSSIIFLPPRAFGPLQGKEAEK